MNMHMEGTQNGTECELVEVTTLLDEPATNDVTLSEPIETGNKQLSKSSTLEYGLEDTPAWHITLFYSFQQITATLAGPLTAVYVLEQCLCLDGENAGFVQSRLLSTSIFMMGLATFIQSTVGVRLPLVQGSAVSFIIPIVVLTNTESWRCRTAVNSSYLSINGTDNMTAEIQDIEPWLARIREISGCLICATAFEALLGFFGIIGVFTRFIGPLSMASVLSLLGISLCEPYAKGAGEHWGVTTFTMLQIITYTLILDRVKVPCLMYSRSKGLTVTYFKFFKLFPILISVLLSWVVCFILTCTNMLPDNPDEVGYYARTDAKLSVIYKAPWIYVPYPGQWGTPTITSVGALLGMFSATLATIIESIGDYYAIARVANTVPPPKHAINRGIMMEGIAGMISGLFGACHPTTSYSSTIAFIVLTGVACRSVWQLMGIGCICLGIFGKAGAILSALPTPIVTGVGLVAIGMLMGAGISMLQFVEMSSSRNILIVGFSHVIGMSLPSYLKNNPAAINTGSEDLDQVLTIFLSTSMCVGGLVACILDNILPGTEMERGMAKFKGNQTHVKTRENGKICDNDDDGDDDSKTVKNVTSQYDIPFIGKYLNKLACCKYLPFLPSYEEPQCNCSAKCNRQKTNDLE